MYFTRIPLPSALMNWMGYSPEMLSQSARYFPAIGVLVGALGAAVFLLGAALLASATAIALAMVATVLLTGAFHEDGLADVCDGFGGASAPERVLEIMRDSRVGAFGAIGIALALLAKFVVLNDLGAHVSPFVLAALLVCGHALSRAAAGALIGLIPYVRESSKAQAKPVAEGGGAFARLCMIVLGIAPLSCAAWIATSWFWLAAVIPVALVTACMAWWFKRRIGGITGDCLGAVQQVTEIVFYCAMLALTVRPLA
jgi:adenosylcobinamide-GDP ribazoletransferase